MTEADVGVLLAHDLLADYLTGAFDRFDRYQQAIAEGTDPEDVHQARVGIRRMRCALRTYRPVFDRLWARSVRNAAVLFAYPLGRVRDADVVLDRETVLLEDLSLTAPDVLASFEKIRDARRAHLVLVLQSDQAEQTLALMKDAVRRPRLIAGRGTTTADLLPSAQSTWRRVRKSVRRLSDTPSDEALHRVRILTKRARYAAEVLRPVVGEDAKAFCNAAAQLQDVLGELQDAAVARAWLLELEGSPGAARLADAELERAGVARAAWPERWELLVDETTSGWLHA